MSSPFLYYPITENKKSLFTAKSIGVADQKRNHVPALLNKNLIHFVWLDDLRIRNGIRHMSIAAATSMDYTKAVLFTIS